MGGRSADLWRRHCPALQQPHAMPFEPLARVAVGAAAAEITTLVARVAESWEVGGTVLCINRRKELDGGRPDSEGPDAQCMACRWVAILGRSRNAQCMACRKYTELWEEARAWEETGAGVARVAASARQCGADGERHLGDGGQYQSSSSSI